MGPLFHQLTNHHDDEEAGQRGGRADDDKNNIQDEENVARAATVLTHPEESFPLVTRDE